MQNDDNDKQQQLSIMDSIYKSAELLVVAAAGSDANAGLPGIGSTSRHISQRNETITGAQFITAQPSIQQVLQMSVWKSRGWTFQEAVLSRRALVFTESLVYWSCQVNTWREDINSESSITRLILDKTTSLWPHYLAERHQSQRQSCRTYVYCQLAEEFSKKAFKEESDVVWAFIGILRLQTLHFQKGFIWSLPYEGLDTTLLWFEDSGCENNHPRQAYHAVIRKNSRYNLAYPSWSWLSSRKSVSFMDACGALIVSEVTWHDAMKFGNKTINSKSISPKDCADKQGEERGFDLLAGSTSERDVMDYGLLQFTAQTAVLTLRRAEERSSDIVSRDRCVVATFDSVQGERIGMLVVPLLFFKGKSECAGEFVLLSSNSEEKSDGECKQVNEGPDCGKFEHVKGCKHVQSRNVMLIEWEGNIAYRQGLVKIDKKIWENVKTEIKTIMLG